MKKGKLFVISGCSGVGKGTVLKLVMAQRKDLSFSVSATTRAPREGEVDGVHYHFVSMDDFRDMIDQGEMLEYNFHNSNYYGTPKRQLAEKQRDSLVVLDIEVVGALNVRKAFPDATLIFIEPPSMEELERRLRGRGDTPEDQIAQRMERAQWEMTQRDKYDHVVLNDVAQDCADKILNIIAEMADEE